MDVSDPRRLAHAIRFLSLDSSERVGRRTPRITALPCAIIMSRVTGRVLLKPLSTLPSESPSSSRSTCGSKMDAAAQKR